MILPTGGPYDRTEYEVQYASSLGAPNWMRATTCSSLESARNAVTLRRQALMDPPACRIIERTITEKVVEEASMRVEPADLAKANDSLQAFARDTGSRNHFVWKSWRNECKCGHVAKDRVSLAAHCTEQNLADQAKGEGRQKYGSVEIGGCKVNVHFSLEGMLMVTIVTGDAEPELGQVRVRVATDSPNLSVAG
jgi:hypothetical protein